MQHLDQKVRLQIRTLFTVILLLGVGISAIAFFSANKISSTTQSLIAEQIPSYELLRRLQAQLTDEERYLYEYYATQDSSYYYMGFAEATKSAEAEANALVDHFGRIEPIEQTLVMIGEIATLAKEFNANMESDSTDWDLARTQLREISQKRREILPITGELKRITAEQVQASQEMVENHTSQVRMFVVFYSIATLIIALIVAKTAKNALANSRLNRRLSLFPSRNPNPVFSMDEQGNVVYMNPATVALLKKLNLDLNDARALLAPDITERKRQVVQQEKESVEFEYQLGALTFSCQLHRLADQGQWDIHLMNISGRKKAEQQLQYQAFHHSETQMENQYGLKNQLQCLCAETNPFTLAVVEVRDFSKLVSSRGLESAGIVVKELAESLQQIATHGLTEETQTYHIGEHRFALIFNHVTSTEQTEAIAQKLNDYIASTSFHCQHQVTLDMGFVDYPAQGEDSNTLLKHARMALDSVQEKQDAPYRLFNNDLLEQVLYEQKMIEDIRTGIENEEFELYFQPQYSMCKQKVIGAEVLVRWFPGGKFVSPGEFIPIAEKSGLIVPLGDWILRTACLKAKSFTSMGNPDMVLAVNISPRQFGRDDFIKKVQNIIAETGVPARNLELEITEGVSIYNADTTIQTLQQLKALGVQLAIDDFGTGYSSLNYLKQFPIDKLKIDQSFVRYLHENDKDQAIARTIIDLGNNLDLTLIAEGVELLEHLNMLQAWGCHEIQGYYFSKPLPEAQYVEFLQNPPALTQAS